MILQKSVIIVAGGKGLRMGRQLPKQFIPIKGKPVLMRTIEAFFKADPHINIVVVLPIHFQDYWKKICAEYKFELPHTVANGGETRFQSVKNGLNSINGGIVAVHDGARPFVSTQLIKQLFDQTSIHSAIIPVTDVTDSLREITETNESKIINRSKIKQVQTPQVFHYDVIKKAYETKFQDSFTDDASVVENLGVNIHLIQGEITNIKITTPFDLEIAKIIIDLQA